MPTCAAGTADSLWQAHDDRYDAEAVLIIPGPEAIAGIEKPDVPVADLLNGFLDRTIEMAPRAGRLDAPDMLMIARESDVCLFGREERPNPIPELLRHCAETVELRVVPSGVRLSVQHELPLGHTETLTLDFDVVPFHPFPLRAHRIRPIVFELLQPIMPDEVVLMRNVSPPTAGSEGPATPEQILRQALHHAGAPRR